MSEFGFKKNLFVFEQKGTVKRAKYLDLADTIIDDIKRGRLKPQDKLPGTRTLAQMLNMHRKTIDAAYQELISQGWLEARPSSGTFVAKDLPVILSEGPAPIKETSSFTPTNLADRILFETSDDVVSDGHPDPRLLPQADLANGFRSAVSSLKYAHIKQSADARGLKVLREAISDYLRQERGVSANADEIIVTRGSQMALYLSAMTCFKSGDRIAVEMPGYSQAWRAFEASGAQIVGIPVDENGLSIDALQSMLETGHCFRALYLTPHHHFPTTVSLSPERRVRLLELAKLHDFLIIEDDYDHEYRYVGQPLLPLIAQKDDDLNIIHIGSFSKILFSGFRLGYLVATPKRVQDMARARSFMDRQGDYLVEKAMASLIEEGAIYRHANKARLLYEERLDYLLAGIEEKLSRFVSVERPQGGLAVWIRLKSGQSARRWLNEASLLGLQIPPLDSFYPVAFQKDDGFRLGFADRSEREIDHLLHILQKIAQKLDQTGE